jgi:DsbC/DsbD-like thiol-disulfide interchange protein
MKRRSLILGALATAPIRHVRAASRKPYRVELLPGEVKGGRLLAGISISLDEGWKTYWRMPGEAGIPPEFDWQGSVNLKEAEVLYPAPVRFTDEGGEAVGYAEPVVFPVWVNPQSTSLPVELRLGMFFAVCKNVCIPAQAESVLIMGKTSQTQLAFAEVNAALARVPRQSPQEWRASATAETWEGAPVLRLEFPNLPAGRIRDVFVESDAAVYFRAPRSIGPAALVLPVDGIKSSDELRGVTIRLTVILEDQALDDTVVVR